MDEFIEVKIDKINDLGCGVGYYQGKKVFIPFTISGEIIKAKIIKENKDFIQAEIREIISPSNDRIDPICKHFALCGNCHLQHMKKQTYINHKINLIKDLIGFDDVKFYDIGEFSRRKVRLKFDPKFSKFGFHKELSNEIIHIEECFVIEKEIFEFIKIFECFLSGSIIRSKVNGCSITKINNKFDLIIESEMDQITLEEINQLTFFANSNNNLIRINWKSKENIIPIIQKQEFTIELDNSIVSLPNEYFLQSSDQSQKFITSKIIEYASIAKKAIDLFAGIGTYSIPLSNFIKVKAIEGMDNMTKFSKNGLEIENRDLFNNPVQEKELNKYDFVVINPPRNGASPQFTELAKSKVNKIAIVSCNPKTFARDFKLLQSEGFKIQEITIIDQFIYSYHMELLALVKKN